MLESITVEDVVTLLTETAADRKADWASVLDLCEDWQLWDGELRDDHYALDGAVIVRGDIALSGDLFVHRDDVLICLGNVECELADLRGEVFVLGDLTSRSFVHANSGNDYQLGVVGTLQAKLFVEVGMATYAKRFDCEVWRMMNAVVQYGDGHRFPKAQPDDQTRARARELLGESACIELLERVDLPE